jgi:hypothetical protein
MTINLKFNLDNIKEDVEKFTTIVESISGALVN